MGTPLYMNPSNLPTPNCDYPTTWPRKRLVTIKILLSTIISKPLKNTITSCCVNVIKVNTNQSTVAFKPHQLCMTLNLRKLYHQIPPFNLSLLTIHFFSELINHVYFPPELDIAACDMLIKDKRIQLFYYCIAGRGATTPFPFDIH